MDGFSLLLDCIVGGCLFGGQLLSRLKKID